MAYGCGISGKPVLLFAGAFVAPREIFVKPVLFVLLLLLVVLLLIIPILLLMLFENKLSLFFIAFNAVFLLLLLLFSFAIESLPRRKEVDSVFFIVNVSFCVILLLSLFNTFELLCHAP